ncbi:putative carboxypeptidase S1 [Xylogone sp. PMI_703]|nr:putative carboxypeptidase S1 [Xylogone sp. PMI_703]
MFAKASSYLAAALLLLSPIVESKSQPSHIPAKPTGIKTIKSPGGVQIRYKEPEICETTPGVRTYSGYIDLDPTTHVYFYFLEARHNPTTAPVTLWLTGGPGSDSLLAAFIENGACKVTDDKGPVYNPYSWSNHSHMLYLSQPVGTGFSYSTEAPGSINDYTGDYQPSPVDGEWPLANYTAEKNTQVVAVTAWHAIQALFTNLPHLDSKVKSRSFNLWTESYGGHYGPVFYDYFYEQNQAMKKGSTKGVELNFNTLGIGNGLIDWATQAFSYPKMATQNTYGIVAVNQTVYDYMQFALNFASGCLAQIQLCRGSREAYADSLVTEVICQEAADMCQDNVQGPYYSYGGRGTYDIRVSSDAAVPPVGPLSQYLNTAPVQNALGVSLNWTSTNNDVLLRFQQTGDAVYVNAMESLEELLDKDVRIVLYYGDADYICNWFGGEAVSLAVNYTHAKEFRAAGYAPFLIDGTEYGEVRERGNFSFVRIYESGHQVPYFQPLASQVLFERSLDGLDISTGTVHASENYATNGSAQATHTEPFVPLSTSS